MATRPMRFDPSRPGSVIPGGAEEVADFLASQEEVFRSRFGPSQFEFVPGQLRTAIEQEMAGMTPQEEAVARAGIRNQFNTAVGNLASRTARAGAFSPSSVRTAATGRPARSLATSLLGLQAQKAQLRRAGSQAAAGQLAGLSQFNQQQERAGQEAFGTEIGRQRQMRDRPVFSLIPGPRRLQAGFGGFGRPGF